MEYPEVTRVEERWRDGLNRHTPGSCLEANVLIDLARGGRRAKDYAASMDHVAVCATCSETLRAIRAADRVRLPRFQLRYGWRSAVVFAMVAATGVAVYFGFQPPRPSQPLAIRQPDKIEVSPRQIPNPVAKSVPQAPQKPLDIQKPAPQKTQVPDRIVKRDPRPSPALAPAWTLAYRDLYERGPGVDRGVDLPNAGPAIVLAEPDYRNRGLVSPPPRFVWRPVEHAEGYEARLWLLDKPGEEAAIELRVDGCAGAPVAPLEPGDYRLDIVARVDPSNLKLSETMPSATYAFTVLTRKRAEEVRWAHSNAKSSPREAAMILRENGRLADALRIDLSLLKDPHAVRWREALKQELSLRAGDPSRW